MPGGVYILCSATCLLCAVMLFRGYAHSGVRLLLWSGLCFFGLMIENSMLYVDLVVMPDIDLSVWRKLPGLIAIIPLLVGLIWETK